jgi:hypothetical protein
MRRRWILLLSALAAMSTGQVGRASNPPVDRAGPLTARVEGPAEVAATGVPVPVRVVLENGGDAPLSGTVELGVIDRWTAAPAGPQAFTLAPGATATLPFRVAAGPGTYDAIYPIHARVRIAEAGGERVAHPILLVTAKGSAPARAGDPPAWSPFPVPASGRLAVWALPARRVVQEVFGRPARALVPGVPADAATGATTDVRSLRIGELSREAVAIHPPWRDGRAGTALVEYPLELPASRPIALDFENAVAPDGRGDGVTFRVRVAPLDAPEGTLGAVVLERHVASRRWGDAARADLSAFAGRSVRLQLESHPGPRRDTSFDQSFWGEPTLVVGTPQPSAPFPPADDRGSIVLGTIPVGGRPAEIRLWPGRRGLLDAAIGVMAGGAALHARGFAVRVRGTRLDDDRSPIVLKAATVEPAPGGAYRVRHAFAGADVAFDLVGELSVAAGALRCRFALENAPEPRPWRVVTLEDVSIGPWSRPARQVYAGPGNVVRGPEAFTLLFDGHRLSTSFVGVDFEGGPSVVLGVDVPPTSFEVRPAERHYALHAAHGQTLSVIPAASAFDGARVWRQVNGLEAAGGVSKVAGRFVFDLWGGRYAEGAGALRRAFRYGLGDSLVVWHNWQRWGYDYRLPDIVPPNPELGTLAEMRDLVAACREAGTLFAPHDNYIDFYPDADDFSYERNIAFHADGTPVRAWLNEGRGAQSYRYRPDRAGAYLEPNVSWLKEHLGPSAYFIDVWSSAPPYDYWTADGRFGDRLSTRRTWGELFAWIRRTLGDDAPQISESGHDALIGWLDGAQTNHLRVGRPVPGNPDGWTVWDWRCEDAERTPWFDVAHHDRFALHGAGYSNRYQGGLDRRLHGIYSDDYIATEVLTGHPAMVDAPFGHDVVRKHWLLNDLMRALAGRTIESVAYVDGDLHRQHVRWSGGGEVRVNRGESDWTVAGVVLPPYGFLARVPGPSGPVEASIRRRDGLVVEESRGPGGVYANGRAVVDGPERIAPRVSRFEAAGRAIDATIEWRADDPIPAGYEPFLHACDADGEIAFQLAQDPSPLRASRQGAIAAVARGRVPDGVAPGTTFELRAGLYHPGGGPRLRLDGPDDGDRRVRLGRIRVREDGLEWAPQPAVVDPASARQNPTGRVVDFGPIATAGGVRVVREGANLVVTPLPSGRVERALDVRLRPDALGWSPAGAVTVEAIAEDGRVLSRAAARREGDSLVVPGAPGAFQYRLVGGEEIREGEKRTK